MILTSTEPNIFGILFSIKNPSCKAPVLYLWWAKKLVLSMNLLKRLVITEKTPENVFSKNHLSLFHGENGFISPPKVQDTLVQEASYNIVVFVFLMENNIPKMFGSIDVKITPDFCFKDHLVFSQ